MDTLIRQTDNVRNPGCYDVVVDAAIQYRIIFSSLDWSDAVELAKLFIDLKPRIVVHNLTV